MNKFGLLLNSKPMPLPTVLTQLQTLCLNGVNPLQSDLNERHETIRAQLQTLFDGRAEEFDIPVHTPIPVGMCPSSIMLRYQDMYRAEIARQDAQIKLYKQELVQQPYVPDIGHNALRLSLPSQHKTRRQASNRMDIINKMFKVMAERYEAEAALEFWQTHFKPASDAFLADVAALFDEKRALRQTLLERHGICVMPVW